MPTRRSGPRPVAVVSHTHWDREWYEPFEAFQTRLAATLDRVLEVLEGDPGWAPLLLDGQVAAVEDYLALRPGAAGKLRKLVESGRITVGPWYVLMDEFGVSGETIVRNLELGMGLATALGQDGFAGYLPDMFGHVAQMPQLLASAGIRHAVVWRGVPSAVGRSAFRWVAPDGSAVRAEYLTAGYANGAFLPERPGDLLRRLEALEQEAGPFLAGPDTPLLVMNGTDHHPIQAFVPSALEEADRLTDGLRISHRGLLEYLEDAPPADLPAWEGELRSGWRAPLLAGVVSNRVDVKRAAAAAELALERLAEPLATLWLPPGNWPGEPLDRAWLEVVRNSAHDSICACSSDEVGRAVLSRYDAAGALASAVVSDVADLAAIATCEAGPLILNPSPHDRCEAVELVLAGDEAPAGAQLLERIPAGVEERRGRGADLGRILGGLAGDGWLGDAGRCNAARISHRRTGRQTGQRTGQGAGPGGTAGPGRPEATGGLELILQYDPAGRPTPDLAPVVAEAWALAGASPQAPLTVRVERSPAARVVALSGTVPGFGWSSWKPGATGAAAVTAGELTLDNGLLSLAVDPFTGTFSLDGTAGLDLLVDGGDAGDTYNYCPPERDRLVATPDSVHVEVLERGPVRGRLRVTRGFEWPERLEGGLRTGAVPVEVVTDLTVVAGDPLVRVATSFDNRCRDHRLRAWFPLPRRSADTEAGCAFASVRRTRVEGGTREPALSTFPARRFVRAGGLTVLHDGVFEYEMAGDGAAIAVTLLRATGVLSRPSMLTRPNVAGPQLAVEGPQSAGRQSVEYAVTTSTGDPWELAERASTPMPVVASKGGGRLPATGTRLEVHGSRVSSLRRKGGSIEVRFFNPYPGPATVVLPGRSGRLVDLRGEETSRWTGSFELRPWGIATAVLDEPDLDA